MSYRTISILLTDPALDGGALDAAAALCAGSEAHLDVFALGLDTARVDAMPLGATAILLDAAETDARGRAEALADWATGRLGGAQPRQVVQPVVLSQLGLEQSAARMMRYSDLIVASQPYGPGRSGTQAAVVESMLFGTGAPVMIVTDAAVPVRQPLRRVAIAWNETTESLAAVRRALPILTAAEIVDVVMVDPPRHSPERSDPGGALSLLLSRHGIRAEVSLLARTLPTVTEVLARFVTDTGADALVMGAYGHSRFREALLGGATRDLMEMSPVPLVMAR